MYECTPQEIGQALGVIIGLRSQFYHVPSDEPKDKPTGEKKRKKRLTANDLYQLVVGEIGISRHEFLYEVTFWEGTAHHSGLQKTRPLHTAAVS